MAGSIKDWYESRWTDDWNPDDEVVDDGEWLSGYHLVDLSRQGDGGGPSRMKRAGKRTGNGATPSPAAATSRLRGSGADARARAASRSASAAVPSPRRPVELLVQICPSCDRSVSPSGHCGC